MTDIASRPYNPRNYKLLSSKDIIIYYPNCVSRQRKVVSA